MSRARLSVLALTLAMAFPLAPPAAAQDPTPAPPPVERPLEPTPAEDPEQDAERIPPPGTTGMAIRARVFGLVGFQTFTASDSFSAVLGTSSGVLPGGGAGLLFGRHLFVDVSVARFTADGTRVFVADGGEVIDLGIDTTVAVTPIDVSIGWRFAGRPSLNPSGKLRLRPVPFLGGGFGFQRYEETSAFSSGDDDVSEWHGSYHALAGVEVPFSRRLAAGADLLYRWVPDALGAAGVSDVYDETDLGGAQVRLRLVFSF